VARTKTKTRRGAGPPRPAAAPTKGPAERRFPIWAYAVGVAALIAAIAAGAFLLGKDRVESRAQGPAESTGLPNTQDYHSLLVAPADPSHVLLGTHAGLYDSVDGGRSWKSLALAGQDAMNLAPAEGEVMWTAGHDVFARSADGGTSWSDVRPQGLPSLDIHGFAVDPSEPARLYAAVAGQGLYRSDNGGQSFERVSGDVGGAVFALAVTPEGLILAGDQERGLLASEDGGDSWTVVERAVVLGLAVNPADPRTIIAGGPGILLSTDAGRTWRQVLALPQGVGPVAWSQSDPDIGYAVGFDRVFYRTNDRGRTWRPVG
jgi:photosystem II stability/assembly factor-like uncharacterized protein